MSKFILVSVSYTSIEIDGMTFLIPSHLRQFERPIKMNFRKILALLKRKGWYDYVLRAGLVTVVMPSARPKQFTWVMGNPSVHPPVFCIDSGGVIENGTSWNASLFVHEATHTFQHDYLSRKQYINRRIREEDALRKQHQFLERCKCTKQVGHIESLLKAQRGYWEYIESGPINKEESYCAERIKYCNHILEDLLPYIAF